MNSRPDGSEEVAEPKGTRLRFLTGLGGSVVASATLQFPALALSAKMSCEHSNGIADGNLRVYGLPVPTDIVYSIWASNDFRGYTVPIGGDVERPVALGIAEMRVMAKQTQNTRLSCVKGWSGAGKWRGVAFRDILAMVRPMSHTRFAVFHCFDRDTDGTPFYESLDLQQASHPETLLALDFNDHPISPNHGGPVRLHVPTQMGYKHAKWIRRIEIVSSLGHIAGGQGGYWEDRGLA